MWCSMENTQDELYIDWNFNPSVPQYDSLVGFILIFPFKLHCKLQPNLWPLFASTWASSV